MNARFWSARQRANISQEQLALDAHINQADVSRIEKHGWTPPKDIRERLAALLKVSPEELFGDVHELAS